MTKRHELRCYDYVNRPLDQVSEALSAHALDIFRRATHGAATHANQLGAEMRVRIGALDISAEVEIEIVAIGDGRSPDDRPARRIDLRWASRRRPGLFPTMAGSLWIYALTARETQLEFAGIYDPPLGVLGDAIDSIALHRIAEASVQRFVNDVASLLRNELPIQPALADAFMLVEHA